MDRLQWSSFVITKTLQTAYMDPKLETTEFWTLLLITCAKHKLKIAGDYLIPWALAHCYKIWIPTILKIGSMAIIVWEFLNRLTLVLNCFQWENQAFHVFWKVVAPIWLQWTIEIWTGISFAAPVMFNLRCTQLKHHFWGCLTLKIKVIYGSHEWEDDHIPATPRLLAVVSQGCPGGCLTFRKWYRGIRKIHQTAPHVVYGIGQEVLSWKIEKPL